MALARPSFKNVGLTTWNSNANSNNDDDTANNDGNDASGDGDKTTNQQCKGGGPRYLIAIWGDEGLDMPLSLPSSPGVGLFYNPSSSSNNNNDNDNGNNNSSNDVANAEWLAQLVNERHVRNWKKIERFVDAMRSLQDAEANEEEEEEEEEEDEEDGNHEYYQNGDEGVNDAMDGMEGMHLDNRHGTSGNNNHKAKSKPKLVMPRSYDVIGDVAVLNSIPEGMDEESYRKMGEMILSRNKGLKVCFVHLDTILFVLRLKYVFLLITFYNFTILIANATNNFVCVNDILCMNY